MLKNPLTYVRYLLKLPYEKNNLQKCSIDYFFLNNNLDYMVEIFTLALIRKIVETIIFRDTCSTINIEYSTKLMFRGTCITINMEYSMLIYRHM